MAAQPRHSALRGPGQIRQARQICGVAGIIEMAFALHGLEHLARENACDQPQDILPGLAGLKEAIEGIFGFGRVVLADLIVDRVKYCLPHSVGFFGSHG